MVSVEYYVEYALLLSTEITKTLEVKNFLKVKF